MAVHFLLLPSLFRNLRNPIDLISIKDMARLYTIFDATSNISYHFDGSEKKSEKKLLPKVKKAFRFLSPSLYQIAYDSRKTKQCINYVGSSRS